MDAGNDDRTTPDMVPRRTGIVGQGYTALNELVVALSVSLVTRIKTSSTVRYTYNNPWFFDGLSTTFLSYSTLIVMLRQYRHFNSASYSARYSMNNP